MSKAMTDVCDRRGFLGLGLGAGALVATSSLPAGADGAARPWPRMRMNLRFVTIDIGATQPFSILHISDTHLSDAYPDEDQWKQRLKAIRTDGFGGRQEEALAQSIEWAKDHCDYLLHTGDFIDWVSRKNLDLLKKYCGRDFMATLGNHEYSHYMGFHREAGCTYRNADTLEMLRKTCPFDVEFSARVVNGVNFVMMNDAMDGVTENQIRQFWREVKRGLPIVLCLHVPLYTDGIWRASRLCHDAARPRDGLPPPKDDYLGQLREPTKGFIADLRKEPLLRAILSGHEHIFAEDRFSPTAMQYMTAGNYGFCGQVVMFL